MRELSQTEQDFILELYQQTDGDPELQVSMYEVGANLGLDKASVATLGQELMIEELIELKSLSGAIVLLEKGKDSLRRAGLIADESPSLHLTTEPFLGPEDLEHIATLLEEIQTEIASGRRPYPRLEELVIDRKTIEVQLLSPRPRTSVLRALLQGLSENVREENDALADRITAFITS